MDDIAEFWHTVAVAEDGLIVGEAFTVIVPVAVATVQGPPEVETVKLKVPDAVGVPLMVNAPALYDPFTPDGKEPTVIVALVALPPTL